MFPAFQGCHRDNPVKEILDFKALLEDYLEIMHTILEEAKAVGYKTTEQKCEPGNYFGPFFSGVILLESQLTVVRVTLSNASDMLSCPKLTCCTPVPFISTLVFVKLDSLSAFGMLIGPTYLHTPRKVTY